jgi:hypothetical protein
VGTDSGGAAELTLAEARALTGLGATKLRELFDDHIVSGRWARGRGGQHRRWDRQALTDWHAAHPDVARPRRQQVNADDPDLRKRVQELERALAVRGRKPTTQADLQATADSDELGRLRAENVALREASVLAGLANQALEEAWRLSDKADEHRRQAQQRIREAVALQQQALSQLVLPGVVPAESGSQRPRESS